MSFCVYVCARALAHVCVCLFVYVMMCVDFNCFNNTLLFIPSVLFIITFTIESFVHRFEFSKKACNCTYPLKYIIIIVIMKWSITFFRMLNILKQNHSNNFNKFSVEFHIRKNKFHNRNRIFRRIIGVRGTFINVFRMLVYQTLSFVPLNFV